MTKWVKLAVASAVVFGASSAMAECGDESVLGLTGEENECCVYNYDEEIVTGYLLDYNNTIGNGSTTIKCQFKPDKVKGKKENGSANEVYSTDDDHTDEVCNTLDADSSEVVTGVWENVVSSAGITSLVCKYSPSTLSTGTAYYIDSAVSGINYTCGSTSGITGADGSFTFEVGSSCTFYLGDIELRSVDTGVLEDGENVYETDVEIARILQSLDEDGDPSNGITIDAGIVTAMSDAGIEALPDTPEEMDAILEAAGVEQVVSEEDARAHLDSTAGNIALTELIVGKTLYMHCTDSLNTLTFQTNGDMLESNGIESRLIPYRIDGDTLFTTEEQDGNSIDVEHPVVEKTSTYIKIDDDNFDDNGNAVYTFLYFTEADAQASTPMNCGGDDGGTPPQPVPANDLVSGTVTFDGHAEAGISTDGAWIRITPAVFANGNGLQCEIDSDGNFGGNCFIHWDVAEVRQAFTASGATFSYGIFRDSNDNTMWDCDEDYFSGANGLTLAQINDSLVALSEHYDDTRTCPQP